VLLLSVEPEYPAEAWVNCVEGSVTVEFSVSDEGATEDMVIVLSEPVGSFEQSALAAIRKFQFAPPGASGDHDLRLRQSFDFTLSENDKGWCQLLAKRLDKSPEIDCEEEIASILATLLALSKTERASEISQYQRKVDEIVKEAESQETDECETMRRVVALFSEVIK
jgi:TonB family protein